MGCIPSFFPGVAPRWGLLAGVLLVATMAVPGGRTGALAQTAVLRPPDAEPASRLEPEERERLRSELRDHRLRHRESERARWRDANMVPVVPPMMAAPGGGGGFVPEEGALRAAVRAPQDSRMLSSEERTQLRLQLRERRPAGP